jgi:hypothetical protein
MAKKEGIIKYDKSNKLVDIIKKCQLFEANHDMMKITVELETGQQLSDTDLIKLINIANQQIKEQQIEVDVYTEYMIRVGLFAELMKTQNVLSTLQKFNFAKFLEEANKKNGADVNKMVNISGILLKISTEQRNTITSLGYLTKAKQILENNDPDNINKKTRIMVENAEKSVDELVDQSLNVVELEDNRVA